jgi:site-specific DNA recombinase
VLQTAYQKNPERFVHGSPKPPQHPDWELSAEHIYRDDGYTGAKLSRPGLDRLRDAASMAAIEQVLITSPDRLARKYTHRVLLIEELTNLGCEIQFLERPMKADYPHDQLLLQIRGAVAEYERNLIAERMRRGRLAKLRADTATLDTRSLWLCHGSGAAS